MIGNPSRNTFVPYGHICGCYFISNTQRQYLHQASLKSHTTVNPTSFTTSLTQTYTNPGSASLSQVRYTFPLYDGVAVSAYTISFGDKILKGVVKQKEEAKRTYDAAISRGETAGLLESLPAGVFGVTLGSIPRNTDIVVRIVYCGELKHDAIVDGLRYVLPTSIAPRYGTYPGAVYNANTTTKGGISITVDVDMGSSAIRRVQSPSHPIAVSMGELSTTGSNAANTFTPSKASATLTLGTTELSEDFVLQIVANGIGNPQAVLEAHPTIPNQRALMMTLVPKFTLEPIHPEIVFIADQSGSMGGGKNTSLVASLKIFLKSLPLGTRFNICAFGSHFTYLWPSSQAYNETNVNTALSFVDGFTASYGGTEILEPIKAAFEKRLQDLPLEVMLLTDGEIWAEQALFSYLNKQISEQRVDARVFTLGIGAHVSHTLVEGVARAGNGFAQTVVQNEEIDQKVIRMLKSALYAHTKDYQLEVNYSNEEEDEEFEMVEKVNDCLALDDPGLQDEKTQKSPSAFKPTSFFDESADLDKPIQAQGTRYAHLPDLDSPKLLQAPSTIPPLFPFSRTTAYLILDPRASQKQIRSVTLRATSTQGPLELTVPVHEAVTGTSIHQLAARKAIQDLEEGRGWLQAAKVVGKNSSGGDQLVKSKYASRFDEIVEREAVKLGEKFQVAGKWTSFVAVEEGSGQSAVETPRAAESNMAEDQEVMNMSAPMLAARRRILGSHSMQYSAPSVGGVQNFSSQSGFGNGSFGTFASTNSPAMGNIAMPGLAEEAYAAEGEEEDEEDGEDLFASYDTSKSATQSSGGFGLFGNVNHAPPPAPPAKGSLFGSFASPASSSRAFGGSGLFGSANTPLPPTPPPSAAPTFGGQGKFSAGNASFAVAQSLPGSSSAQLGTVNPTGVMHRLIGMQTFSGAWGFSDTLVQLLNVEKARVDFGKFGGDADAAATALAVAHLEKRMAAKRDVWDLVVGKARAWLRQQLKLDAQKLEEFIAAAAELLD